MVHPAGVFIPSEVANGFIQNRGCPVDFKAKATGPRRRGDGLLPTSRAGGDFFDVEELRPYFRGGLRRGDGLTDLRLRQVASHEPKRACSCAKDTPFWSIWR